MQVPETFKVFFNFPKLVRCALFICDYILCFNLSSCCCLQTKKNLLFSFYLLFTVLFML